MKKRTVIDVDTLLAQLKGLESENDSMLVTQTVSSALAYSDKRVVALAAKICTERLIYDLEPELITAYKRLLVNANKVDSHCTGKSAIVRALVDLGCKNVDFYLAGIRYQQLEPVWGGRADTAINIRNSSAVGLIDSGYSRAVIELIDLLNDPEPRARIGAVHALNTAIPYEAALVLRQKICCGDTEPEVIGECFVVLLNVDAKSALPLVKSYLNQDNEIFYELAALALGESRLTQALLIIQSAWEKTFDFNKAERTVLMRAATLHRSDEAFEWLLSLVHHSDNDVIKQIIDLLSIYRHNMSLKEQLAECLPADKELKNQFVKCWE